VLRRGADLPHHGGAGAEPLSALQRGGAAAAAVKSVAGVELGSREPVFDITISAAKKSAFSRLTQNGTAKECYQLGFFIPANAEAALAALEMMGFEGIEMVRQRVRQNGTLARRLQAAQQQLAGLARAAARRKA